MISKQFITIKKGGEGMKKYSLVRVIMGFTLVAVQIMLLYNKPIDYYEFTLFNNIGFNILGLRGIIILLLENLE